MNQRRMSENIKKRILVKMDDISKLMTRDLKAVKKHESITDAENAVDRYLTRQAVFERYQKQLGVVLLAEKAVWLEKKDGT